ncbi:MAG: ATP-binding cassette domain-containing protein [Candidatus Omnitrophica bacterium]|nr:ATP-binding cassette domain-containing protein [Candidatus Omnitrophota bacterium]
MPALLQIKQLHKAYGAAVIFDDASAAFSSDQKIGVIGRNGAGKTTLCRILTGHETADSGTITRSTSLRLRYLEQHDNFLPGETAVDFLMRTTGAEHWECGAMAARFQIKNEMLAQPIQVLPGGYQTRVKLTAMLLGRPNFLVLDEPSNYLDLSTLILLETFLQGFHGGYLVVSHDREFLKRTCDHTLECEGGQLTLYPGDIEEYFEFKEEQIAQKQAFNRSVEKKREQLQAFIDRFRAKAATASRAQAKVKQLEKLKTIEIAHPASTVRITIPPIEDKAGVALSCEDLAIGYPEKDVARGIHFDIERGAHVAVLGDNGEGKTTFLKTLAGQLAPKSGTFRWGTGLKVAYYAQHVFSLLDPEDDIDAYLMRSSAPDVTHQDVLAMAGCFLFKGDDVEKKVKVLSGGERARLVLAGLLLSKSQVLLLDEPTNHLDFETVEALGRALKNFPGTVFFISHDRTFVNLLATSILEVKRGKISRYPGSYEDYVYHLELMAHGGQGDPAFSDPMPSAKKALSQKPKGEDCKDAEIRESPEKGTVGKSSRKGGFRSEIAKIKKNMDKVEQRMQHYMAERTKILDEIAQNPFRYSRERNTRLKELQARIEEAEDEWYSLEEKLQQYQGRPEG